MIAAHVLIDVVVVGVVRELLVHAFLEMLENEAYLAKNMAVHLAQRANRGAVLVGVLA